jgi:hypothetical protein
MEFSSSSVSLKQTILIFVVSYKPIVLANPNSLSTLNHLPAFAFASSNSFSHTSKFSGSTCPHHLLATSG